MVMEIRPKLAFQGRVSYNMAKKSSFAAVDEYNMIVSA